MRNDRQYHVMPLMPRILACLLAMLSLSLLAGCGGGGGGSSSPPQNPNTATVVGTIVDQPTGTLLANRTITILGTSLSAISDSNGKFTINNVPLKSETFVAKDSSGTANGQITLNVSTLQSSGNTRTFTFQVTISGINPPPPPV